MTMIRDNTQHIC